jgi:hypothetical protein
MKRRRPPRIPLRRQIYVGCEGASERAYAAFLQDLALAASLPIYLNIEEPRRALAVRSRGLRGR